jgi:multidrug resistance efflux pump
VEKSQIEAPTISLSSTTGGVLENLYVNPGDMVAANEAVAEIGNDIVRTRDPGLVISTQNSVGTNFTPGETVVTIIKPEDLRVDAEVEEDKGLADIKVGQKALFTVDAFGSKKYYGIADEISPTARTSDVVFNISSQREMQDFDVKIRFDINQYPELKNGMSAKAWIFKD